MSLAIATIPGVIGEGFSQLLDGAVVELPAGPGPITYDIQAVIGPQARLDGVSIFNGGGVITRVRALDAAGQPIGVGVGAQGHQLVYPGHTIQFGFEDADLIALLEFQAVELPVSNPAGQVAAHGTLGVIAAGPGNFLSVNVIEK